jgi:hypothetical protein
MNHRDTEAQRKQEKERRHGPVTAFVFSVSLL